jgi:hypothetical protein
MRSEPSVSPVAKTTIAKTTIAKTTIDAMADDIAVLAAHIDAATRELLAQIRAFDQADGWHRQNALSCAHWLSWRIGMGLGAAREKVRVAHRLGQLPVIDAAFGAGELSYSKVRAMTRVATTENEETLLSMARKTTAAQLENLCRLFRGAQSSGQPAPVAESLERWVRTRDTSDGMVNIELRLLPEEAARMMGAIAACRDGGSQADGAVHLAEMALLGGPTRDETGRKPVRPPVEVVMHVSAETLEAHTSEGHGLSSDTARRLLCDGAIVPMLEDERGKTLDVGRKTRRISAALRRALQYRDGGCQFPGCDQRRFVDAHHIEHWVDEGETVLSNLVTTCRSHHRYLHEHGYSVVARDDEFVFFDPDGRQVPAVGVRPPRKAPVAALKASLRQRGLAIDVRTNACGWDGEPVDYERAVNAIV